MLYACKGHGQTLPERVHTPSLPVRERERVSKWEGEKVRQRGRKREREGERERVFIFKRNDGCLGTF